MTIHHFDWMGRHPVGPGRTPTVHWSPYVGWPWVAQNTSTSTSQSVHTQHGRGARHDSLLTERAINPKTGGRRLEDRHNRNAGDVHDCTGDQANESEDLWRL